MSEQPWLEALNDKQSEAVTYRPAPLLVLAGPGSGKTRILTHRIAWLIGDQGALPEHILAVTFTNRAAEEMRERLFAILDEQASRIWVYTFHATAVRILRRDGARIGIDPDFVIVDEDEQRHAINRLMVQLDLSRELYPVGRSASYISERKNNLENPADPQPDSDPALVDLARAYENWLTEHQALDFDDLIRYAVGLLRNDNEARQHYHRTLQHILVDEYQDINTAQYEFLKLLAPPGSSVTVVADDDQSIYGWRGSHPELIDDFIERYNPHVVKLDLSYRCPPTILYGAQNLIIRQRSQERQRFLHSTQEDETPIFHYIFNDIAQERHWLVTLIQKLITERGYKPGDIGILYRTHRLANPTEQALVQAGFKVHRLRKESFFDQPITRDIVRYLQLVRLLSEESFAIAMNFPRRQIDELTMIQLKRLATAEEISLVELVRRCDEYPEISPLTRAHLRRFLRLVDEQLPDPAERASVAIRAIFEQIEALRSPWRDEDIKLLEGFLRFTDLSFEADELGEAIEDGHPIVIAHPTTVDGYAAAYILSDTLREYLGVTAVATPLDDLASDDLEPDAVVVVFSEGASELLLALPQEHIIIGPPDPDQIDYALSTYAWRCAQLLLIAYETLADGRFIVYDLETTGTNIRRDEIVEIAAATYENQEPIGEMFQQLVRPARGYIPRAATRVHGIRYDDVAEAPTIAQVLPEFLDYVGDETVVGHNIARFDNRFLDRAMGDCFDGRGFSPSYLDTLRLARRLLPGQSRFTLEALGKALKLEGVARHRAEDDLKLTANLFFALTDYIVEEKEREALSEYLPLVGLGIMAGDIAVVDENQSLLNGAHRMLAVDRGRSHIDALLAMLPPVLQGEMLELVVKLEAQPLAASEEDITWNELREMFFQHVEAFETYSQDPTLASFLDYQALLNSIDTFAHTDNDDYITMMTLHNAKGSEFPVVIIIGVEQDNLPLWRTLDDPKQLAEERRVLYVGITRAKEAVYLFSTRDRSDGFLRSPSRFAFEIPTDYIRRFRIDAKGRIQELTR